VSFISSEVTVRCDAVLFDLDGVLVDSRACVERILREWAHMHALDPAHVIAVAHGRRTVETIGLVAPHLSAAREAQGLTGIESTATDGVAEVRGARDLLQTLPPSRWAIVTSGARAVATLRLAHTHLPQPSVLICAEDVRRGKPAPDGYRTAANHLGVDPGACIVIEDAPAGLEAARAAGMQSVAVATTHGVAALELATYTVPTLAHLAVGDIHNGTSLEIRLAPA